ncbi:hypothetical protein GRI55_02580 [Erythrobacter citreus]|uniref:Uncharacterized protein n=1 Tax=Qipengyuania citrea TaxID=225971 RepID=A0A6I4U6R8_9SPHN|nr:hypothetical protein [Qipengyuania citrea]MDQ0566291.1 hypothetical protein [Qipengyuania citrea]MXP34650.1 hypothetical protein [Qipengyuania citrea]
MSNRLPETDLANWALLSREAKRSNLEAHERPKLIPGSYEPFRKVFPDAINQQYPLFASGLQGSRWEEVDRRLRQECKRNEKLIKMNREILQATHDYARMYDISALAIDAQPLRFFGGTDYFFGLRMLVRYRDRASFVFLDMRRKGLSPAGREFVFSALHHRYREPYPDFKNAHIEIWNYRNNRSRDLVCLEPTFEPLSWDVMSEAVIETHRIWEEVRRGDAIDRRATGTLGPLFD